MQAGGPEGCGPRVSWVERPATTCEGAGGQEGEAEVAGGTDRCTDTECVSHCSTIVRRILKAMRQADHWQAGRLEAGGPGEGGTESEVQARKRTLTGVSQNLVNALFSDVPQPSVSGHRACRLRTGPDRREQICDPRQHACRPPRH